MRYAKPNHPMINVLQGRSPPPCSLYVKKGACMKKNEKIKEMKIDRFFGNYKVIIPFVLSIDLLFGLLVNYLANVLVSIPDLLGDLNHPENYLGLRKLLPDISSMKKAPIFFLVIGIVCLVIMTIFSIRQIFRMRAAFASAGFNMGQKGVERWTTNEEIREQYKEIPDRSKPFPGYGGTIISRIENKLYIDDSVVNNLIIGITRSGKGEMYVLPSIDVYSRAEEKTSLVITDPKLELYKSSKETLEKRGYEVYLLNLDDPLHSMGFNPLSLSAGLYLQGDYGNAELLIQAFTFSLFNSDKPVGGDSFWQDTSSNLLTALILAHMEDCVSMDREESERTGEECHENLKKINMYSVLNTFTELARMHDADDPDLSALDLYFNSRPAMNRAKLKYAGIEIAGNRTKGSVFATMLSKLNIFTFENIAKMTAESTLDLERIGFDERPIAVFIGIPDYDKSAHFVASTFIRQLYFVLAKRATNIMSGKCPNRVKIIADEFGNIPAIESMENIITVCLGRNISFDLYVQSYSQLDKLYENDAKTIKGNCGNHIYLLTEEEETAESFSKLLGNETIIDMQRSGERLSTKKHFMESMSERPLLNMNELMSLYPGEGVVKRVMKRTDLKGNRIQPTPIFNSEESGKRFLFRYEYLTDTFPDPDIICLQQINSEDRSHIILADRVWDAKKWLRDYMAGQGKTKDVFLAKKTAAEDEDNRNKQDKRGNQKLSELAVAEQLLSTASQLDGLVLQKDMTVSQAVQAIAAAKIPPRDKELLLGLITLGQAQN